MRMLYQHIIISSCFQTLSIFPYISFHRRVFFFVSTTPPANHREQPATQENKAAAKWVEICVAGNRSDQNLVKLVKQATLIGY